MSRLTPLVIPAAVMPDSDRGEDPLGCAKKRREGESGREGSGGKGERKKEESGRG